MEAAGLSAKSFLIDATAETIEQREFTQKEAAALVGKDQPTLSKVLRGRMESVTIDRLTAWLTALGRTVEIRVRPYDARKKEGHLVALICPKGETVGLGSCHIRGPLRLTR